MEQCCDFAVLSVSKAQNNSNDCDQQEHEDQAAVHCTEGKTYLPLREGEHKLCDNGTLDMFPCGQQLNSKNLLREEIFYSYVGISSTLLLNSKKVVGSMSYLSSQGIHINPIGAFGPYV